LIADLEPEMRARLQGVALDAYRALRVRDYGRIDMRLTGAGEIYVIEVNASCYLEEESEFAMAAEAEGIGYTELINRIPKLALERWKHRTKISRKKKRAAAKAKPKPKKVKA
jgi:D-alanine-D-alanine ligase